MTDTVIKELQLYCFWHWLTRWDTFPQYVCQYETGIFRNLRRTQMHFSSRRCWLSMWLRLFLTPTWSMGRINAQWCCQFTDHEATAAATVATATRNCGCQMAFIQLRRTNCKSLDNVKLNRASLTVYCFLAYSLFLVCLPPRIYVYCRWLLRVSDVIRMWLREKKNMQINCDRHKRIFLVLHTKWFDLQHSQSHLIFCYPNLNPNRNRHLAIMT